jgi:hypothetical protein
VGAPASTTTVTDGVESLQAAELQLIDSTVEGYRAVEMSGGWLSVTGSSSIEGIPGDDGEGLAIQATGQATIELEGATVTGPMEVGWSEVGLDETTTQSMPAEFTNDNEVSGNGGIYVSGASTLAGNLVLWAFANGYFESGTGLAGNLECGGGSDAWCEDSSVISGTSNCAQCLKP